MTYHICAAHEVYKNFEKFAVRRKILYILQCDVFRSEFFFAVMSSWITSTWHSRKVKTLPNDEKKIYPEFYYKKNPVKIEIQLFMGWKALSKHIISFGVLLILLILLNLRDISLNMYVRIASEQVLFCVHVTCVDVCQKSQKRDCSQKN